MNMKRYLKWAPLLLASLSLSACVTYYYPVVDSNDGVYYAADDPVYSDYSADYSSVRYYPWWSVDYLYLGSGYYGNGWSFGMSVGVPAYPSYGWTYYPAWHYSPWYGPSWYGSAWYGSSWAYWPWYGHGWRNHYWYSHYRSYHDNHHGGRHPGSGYSGHHDSRRPDDRYVAGSREDGRRPGASQSRPGTRNPMPADSVAYGETGYRRHVSTAPSAQGGDRGSEIRSRAGAKPGPTRLEPVNRPVQQEARGASRTGAREPYNEVRRNGSTVRYAAESKPGKTRIEPVGRQPAAPQDMRRTDSYSARVVSQSRPGVVTRAPSSGQISQARPQAPPGVQASSSPRPAAGQPRMAPPRQDRERDARSATPRPEERSRPKDPDRRKRD